MPAPLPVNADYRLVFIDLDGTLVGKDEIVSPRNVAALDAAQAAGCTIVISTARNRHTVERIAAQWQGHGYAILSNGAIIAEWETGRVLQKIALSGAAVRRAAQVANQHGASALLFGAHAESDGGAAIYTDGFYPHPDKYLERNSRRLIFREDLVTADDLRPVGIGVYGSHELVDTLTQAWRDALGDEVAAFASRALKSECWCAYVYDSKADKAKAAARVAEMLNIPREQTLAIGDERNDLALLRWAGWGVCMRDGHEDAKAAADHVTGSLAEDGVAQAIERFVLSTATT